MAACDQAAGVVLASTDVDGKTNEITRFQPLLDQIGDLRDTVITADALHCQREHVDHLAERGAHWILTVKGNQPRLHRQLSGLPWRAAPDVFRDTDRGRGRREIRTVKALTISTGIDFPHAAQALQIRRRRRRLDQPKRFTTETVYAITDLRVHQAKPAQLAAWIRGHWSIENKIHWVRDVTYDEDRSQIRTGTGPEVMAALRNAALLGEFGRIGVGVGGAGSTPTVSIAAVPRLRFAVRRTSVPVEAECSQASRPSTRIPVSSKQATRAAAIRSRITGRTRSMMPRALRLTQQSTVASVPRAPNRSRSAAAVRDTDRNCPCSRYNPDRGQAWPVGRWCGYTAGAQRRLPFRRSMSGPVSVADPSGCAAR
ncbi:ISAs1 family transposase [Micromonospora sp. B11E3]|uniref:ISAs1 family transposase n=1 Tax=Micromonospora sp. B11E3 TaxID=3153562 RepID=UPI00325D4B8F